MSALAALVLAAGLLAQGDGARAQGSGAVPAGAAAPAAQRGAAVTPRVDGDARASAVQDPKPQAPNAPAAEPPSPQGQDPKPAGPATPLPPVPPMAVQNPFLPFDRAKFEAACRALGATEAQLGRFGAEAADVGLARAADDLMRAVSPALAAACKRRDDGDPEAAVALAQVLADAKEPALRAHARYHLARLFVDGDEPELAIRALNDYFAQDLNVSPLDGEAAFFYAQALADVPMPEHALPRFQAFLQWFPDASERFRAAAQQRIGELQRQQESRLHELADGMQRTTRDLRKQRTGKPVQVDQEGYLEQLNQLIEEFEQRESQSSGAPSGNQPSANPANQSQAPEGESNVGELNKRPTLADRWGDMKDADREKIAAKLQKGLPPQYQKMLEEYYKKLGKGGGRK